MSLKQVDSTNTFLKNLLSNSKPVPEGTVIMAEDQFAGRGQHQNVWHAEPGKNLTFSMLLYPTFLAATAQFDLTRVISLGVYDALAPLLRDRLCIKWPNDIYYGNKKLSGMLIENSLQGSNIKSSVIGIGVNINQEHFGDNASRATSVKQILQRDYDLKNILFDICRHVEAWYLKLKAGKTDLIRAAYKQKLYLLNETHNFVSNNEVFSGTITGVTDAGLLEVARGNTTGTYNLKEIQFLTNNL